MSNTKNGPQKGIITRDIVNDSLLDTLSCNSFLVYESINNNLNMVYQNKNYSIVCYNIDSSQKMVEIKFGKKQCYYSAIFNHIKDINNKFDLIIIGFIFSYIVQIWETEKWNCILSLSLSNINRFGRLGPLNFLRNQNAIFFVTSFNSSEIKAIKVFDLYGKKIKDINNSDKNVFYLEIFKENNNNYIIIGSDFNIISYDYNKNKIFKIFHDKEEIYNARHYCLKVINNQNKTKLLESCMDGKVRIWDYFAGDLIKKIRVNDQALFGICYFNEENIIIGSDGTIILLNIKNNECLTFKSVKNEITTIQSVHNTPVKTFACQNLFEGKIQLFDITTY